MITMTEPSASTREESWAASIISELRTPRSPLPARSAPGATA